MPANHGQLSLLTSGQIAEIEALGPALQVAELVKIYWPSPDGAKVYSWWNCLADSAYETPLTTWLDGAPLIPAFVAQDAQKKERFHNIPRTSAIGDDVITMRFANYGQVFETLCYKWRGGVKVEVFYFFPQLESGAGLAVSWFLGHLRTPEDADADFVTVPVANGFRSAQLDVPNRPHSSNCGFYFGGELTTDEDLHGNPCDYDRHLGGARGNLDGGSPFTFCKHTEEDCLAIMGDLKSFGGFKPVIDSTLIGAGEHKTTSTTVGNESRLKDPVRVIYGTRRARSLFLLNYAKEYNPSEDHQDKGTIRTLFEVSEGSVKSISAIRVMDRDFPRPGNVAGTEIRLGTQQQNATTYSPSVGNYNRLAHFRADLNPIDPNGVQGVNIVAEADVQGRDTVRIYTDYTTYTEAFTNLRAWCLLDLLTDKTYGHKLDVHRFKIEDFTYLAGKGSVFDADVQGRTVAQVVEDICLAGRWYPPFNYDGYTRILPIEEVDLSQADIPHFTDSGSGRNILWDRDRATSRLKVSYKDDDLLPNSVITTIEDKDNGNIERPLTFNAWSTQYREGQLYGDKSKRKVQRQFAAFGLTRVDDVRTLGEMLIKIGPFGTGGLLNNCAVEFAIDAHSPLALNLHENKIVRVTSDKLTPYEDPDGNTFEFFLIQSLFRNSKLELIVRAQAWFYDLCELPGGTQTGWVIYPASNSNVVDGPNGVRTHLYSVNASDPAITVTYPSTISASAVTEEEWVHTMNGLPPTTPGSFYRIGQPTGLSDFEIFPDGSAWIWTAAGLKTSLVPAGTLGPGATVGIRWKLNSGGAARTREYRVNGTTVWTDTNVASSNGFKANPLAVDIPVGPTQWSVTYTGCSSEYYISPVESGGQGTTAINIEPSLLSNSSSLYAPTVSLGIPGDIDPPLLSASPTLYAPTVSVSFSLPSISANYLQWCEARLETGLSDGDAVATFTDQSGNANNWSQSSGSLKPIYKTSIVNGRAVLRFDGSDDYMTLASDIMSGKSAGEVFLVVKLAADPTSSNKDGLWKMDGDGTNAVNFPYNGDGKLYEGWGSTTRKSTGVDPTPSLAAWRLYNVSSKASEFKIRLDGTEIYSTATNTFSSFGATRNLGRSVGLFGNTYLYGDIAAIVIVDAVLSGTDRDTVENYLATIYGLTVA